MQITDVDCLVQAAATKIGEKKTERKEPLIMLLVVGAQKAGF